MAPRTTTAPARPSADALLGLFPPGTTAPDGTLRIGGCSVTELAERHGTPALLIDEAALRARARRYADGLAARRPDAKVSFASKAFPCTAVYRLLAEEGLGVDVASGGELALALAGGTDPAKLIVHGNAKTDAYLRAAVEAGAGLVVIDNFDDIDRLERILAGTPGREQAVLVRVTPDVRPDTHEAISTGQRGAKFGLLPPEARAAIDRLRGSDRLRLDGLHVHIGSQILDTEPFVRAVAAVAELGEFDVYDLGGGLGARYTYADHPPSVEDYLDALTVRGRRAAARPRAGDHRARPVPGRGGGRLALPRRDGQARRRRDLRRGGRRNGRQPRSLAVRAAVRGRRRHPRRRRQRTARRRTVPARRHGTANPAMCSAPGSSWTTRGRAISSRSRPPAPTPTPSPTTTTPPAARPSSSAATAAPAPSSAGRPTPT